MLFILVHLFEECYTHRDCYKMEFAKCSDSNQCMCRDEYLPINESTRAASLGAACAKNAQCKPSNLRCVQNKCQYPVKPIVLLNDESVPSTLRPFVAFFLHKAVSSVFSKSAS